MQNHGVIQEKFAYTTVIQSCIGLEYVELGKMVHAHIAKSVEVAERFAYFGIAGNLMTYLTKVMGETTVSAARNVNVWSGGHKPCIQAFGADQFKEESEEERRAKNSFFNWWFLGICGGGTSAMLIVFYVQDNIGWTIGYIIIVSVMAFALVIFFLGRNSYQRQATSGSSLTRVAQVLVAAARKSHLPSTMNNIHWEGEDTGFDSERRSIARTKQFRFLDKASFIDEIDASHECIDKWRLCSTAQVEEVKMLIRLVPIWVSCLMYAVVVAQPNTFFIKQSSTLDRKIGNFVVPAASLQVAMGLTAFVTVFIYDRFIVPIARKITGTSSGLTMLQRIGVGIFLTVILTMAAALVERRRLKIVRELGLVDHPNVTIPMSVWWLLPQYMILGVADVFTLVGLQQFFYDQMPDGLQIIGAAAYLCIIGMGSFLISGIISIVGISSGWLVNNLNSAHLDYFYCYLEG
ncbi:protein NRT1/ PTR FAMILY 5.4-like protein [Cinnamomum micranthum f. kanehirae]|uniref:Protein NRT1/ PTR FAMILY 5.4-like protein n=1 Tax=Cinnamomum micranthum f. kanehirae TaxID=337451 RepID=A0A443P3D0_9MAGN|nr:protein NRT1/ PTR FAMILY 5.4-like protein [Cinnamomum micranthum f. kanehirae]